MTKWVQLEVGDKDWCQYLSNAWTNLYNIICGTGTVDRICKRGLSFPIERQQPFFLLLQGSGRSRFSISDSNLFLPRAGVLCNFGKLGGLVKLNWMKVYCFSLYIACYGTSVTLVLIESVCLSQSQRRRLRRVFGLVYNAHSGLLSPMSGRLPIMDELCKRFLLFSQRCWLSDSDLVRFVFSHATWIHLWEERDSKAFNVKVGLHQWSVLSFLYCLW